ncbi:YihY/virulence factor BrkB family protein [uncultured Clostridium sp.]|mgnify:CR=1 FL=1|uniref:YihY/virulence factor BrkB family protein n=1 Tax=uncultured Clostridium sp. TaxID=59620 RepID=UPI0025F9FCFB|nr:YihY/virulence factor BrkB family protein [uncultured Clostridium sp.]
MSSLKCSIRSQINLLIHLIVKIKRDDVVALSSQLAYYLILSFFPFMIFLITLVGLSPLSSVEVLNNLNTILPKSIVDLTKSIIYEVVDTQHTGLLGVSILLMIWTSSSAFRAVIKGVNKAYDLKENRSFIKRAIISMIGIMGLALIIVLALAMLVFGNVIGNNIINRMPFYRIVIFLWNMFRYAFVFIVMIFIFAIIYMFSPTKRLKSKEVIPGAIFSTVGWIAVSFGFSFYINNFGNYSRFYGSLGAVFILMTWLFLISMIFILGVEINCVIGQIKDRNLKSRY